MASFRRRFGTLPVNFSRESEKPKLNAIFPPTSPSTPVASSSSSSSSSSGSAIGPSSALRVPSDNAIDNALSPTRVRSASKPNEVTSSPSSSASMASSSSPSIQDSKSKEKVSISTMLATQYNNTVREARSRSSPKPPLASVFATASLPNQLAPSNKAPLQQTHASEPQMDTNINATSSEEAIAEKDKQRIAQHVVDLWDPKGENSELEALKRLRQLTLKERNLALMRHAGVVRICADYIKKYDVNLQQPLHPLQQHATTLLAALIRNGDNMKEATRFKVLPKILEMLRHPHNSHLSESITIISELSQIASNRVILKKSNYLNAIIPMLKTNREGSTLIALLDSLYLNILYDATNLELACKLGCVENLTMLICHELGSVKLRAIKTLGILVTDNPSAQKVVKKEPATIGFLIKNLITDSGDMLEATAFAISKIVENDTDIQLLVHKGYIWTPLDQRLLKSPNTQLQAFGTSILRSLVKNNTMIQNELRKKGGIIPMVIQNLKSESEEVRQYSLATTLEIIRNNPENQKEVFQMDVLPTLVNFLTETNNNITHYLALGIIWSLTKKSVTRKRAFIDAGIKDVLANLNRSTSCEQVKRGIEWTSAAITQKGTASVLTGYISSFVDKELFV